MKKWHAKTITGAAEDLEKFLQSIGDMESTTVMGMTQGPGPYPSWTVVWYEYVRGEDQR